MSGWQIGILAAVAAGVWMLIRRLARPGRPAGRDVNPDRLDFDAWLQQARKRIELLEEKDRKRRELAWIDLNPQRQLDFSDRFLVSNFGRRASAPLPVEKKLLLGKAHFFLLEEGELSSSP